MTLAIAKRDALWFGWGVVAVSLVLEILALLQTDGAGAVAAVVFALPSVFLFASLIALVVFWAGLLASEIDAVREFPRPALFERPPPFLPL